MNKNGIFRPNYMIQFAITLASMLAIALASAVTIDCSSGPAPTLTLSPNSGPQGTAVTISSNQGLGATGSTVNVNFGGTTLPATVDASSQVTVTAPTGSGTATVYVTVGSSNSPTASFTYTTAAAAALVFPLSLTNGTHLTKTSDSNDEDKNHTEDCNGDDDANTADVQKTGQGSYSVDGNYFDGQLSNWFGLLQQASVVPAYDGSKPDGIKFESIKGNSVFCKVGFRKGDSIQKINGCDASMDNGLPLFLEFQHTSDLTVEGKNPDGKSFTYQYHVNRPASEAKTENEDGHSGGKCGKVRHETD